MYEKIFEAIEKRTPEYVKIWEDVGNIESPTADKAAVDEVGAYMQALGKKHGWKIETAHMEASGDPVCLTMNPRAPGTPVCISGHLDTVHNKGVFGTPAVRIEGDKIFGPGIADCKGGVIAGLLAMQALEDVGFDARPVKLILQTDEENGSRTSNKETVKWMAKQAEGCAAFLNTEAYTPDYATVQRKGILRYKIRVTGRETHSSRRYDGVNAIAGMAPIILELDKFNDKDGLTCNCGVITGGTVANTVAGQCELIADFRYATAEEKNLAVETMERFVKNPPLAGTTVELIPVSYRVAMERRQETLDLLSAVNEIFAANGIPMLTPRFVNGGSDAADISAYGIPCLDSVGVECDNSTHSIREFAYISSMVRAAKRLAAVAYGL